MNLRLLFILDIYVVFTDRPRHAQAHAHTEMDLFFARMDMESTCGL